MEKLKKKDVQEELVILIQINYDGEIPGLSVIYIRESHSRNSQFVSTHNQTDAGKKKMENTNTARYLHLEE